MLQCLAQVSLEFALQKVIFVHLRSTCAFVISKHTIIYLPINSYITSSRHTTPGHIRLDNPGSRLLHRLGRIGVGWSEIVTAEFISGACTVGGIIKWVAQSQILCVAFLHCRGFNFSEDVTTPCGTVRIFSFGPSSAPSLNVQLDHKVALSYLGSSNALNVVTRKQTHNQERLRGKDNMNHFMNRLRKTKDYFSFGF